MKQQEVCLARGDLQGFENACRREWLVTNGVGGFASGTVSDACSRRYHGLLVAALNPPVGRTALVARADITVKFAGCSSSLGANEYADGTVDPHGYRQLERFRLDGLTPVWTYVLADALLERRVFMAHGRNTSYMTLRLLRASAPAEITVAPLCTYRDYHSHSRGGWQPGVSIVPGGCEVRAFDGALPYRITSDAGVFEQDLAWHWNFRHRDESARGLDDIEDLFRPGTFRALLEPGTTLSLIFSAEAGEPEPAAMAAQRETRRQTQLVQSLPAECPHWVAQLALAADQFIVDRVAKDGARGRTVIAGYPWFSDWGRDTMIALPGLTLATGRTEVAADVLRTFALHVSEGMLPNRFPDAGEAPEYNTVDATLWYFEAIEQHRRAAADDSLAIELYPLLTDIVDWHLRGTRYGIAVDENDGLLRAGHTGTQLTWMDARVGDRVITPRTGKAVEINALWFNALAIMANLAGIANDNDGVKRYQSLADRVAAAFALRFWNPDKACLYDVIDVPDATRGSEGGSCDASIRPNQLFALSLSHPVIDGEKARDIVTRCARELWTPMGLRSLSPFDEAYTGTYVGGPGERDAVYHQGTVWSWLLGPFAIAHFRAYGDAALALEWLDGMAAHLGDACLGSVSEIFDGDPPHTPRGCFAQAWGVAETLRAWVEIQRAAASRTHTKAGANIV